MSNLVDTVHKLMVDGHAGQFRRDKITPYHTHPETVNDITFNWVFHSLTNGDNKPDTLIYLLIKDSFGKSGLSIDNFLQLIQILSLTHDIPEDAGNKGFTIDFIMSSRLNYFRKDYPSKFFDLYQNALEALTHDDPKESYLDYILRVKQNPIASIIKLADIEHNLSTLEPNRKANNDKYMLARYILLN